MIQGNLTAAGVPVIEALDISSTSINNIIIREAMTEVKRGVFGGVPLSELFEKRPDIFTATFSAMVSVGENTGNMEEMLESIALYYEEEMDAVIQKLTSMLEPIMIVFMGVTIGFILVAIEQAISSRTARWHSQAILAVRPMRSRGSAIQMPRFHARQAASQAIFMHGRRRDRRPAAGRAVRASLQRPV